MWLQGKEGNPKQQGSRDWGWGWGAGYSGPEQAVPLRMRTGAHYQEAEGMTQGAKSASGVPVTKKGKESIYNYRETSID